MSIRIASIRIALATLLVWGAGCTQDSTPGAGKAALPGAETAVASATGALSQAAPARNRSFADLPDRGDLVAYPTKRVVRHDGAYTWHRAGLSEEHALRAVGGGVMHFTTPAGERLQFQYERHVEHPSGDWTWIGRAKGGAASDEVVLTFGEKAVFGTISQPGQAPLKLTMGGGVSWLIETDRSRIADIDNPATRPRNPDFLIPPKITAGIGASAESMQVASAPGTTENATAAATTTVDVLLGYTPGFASAQGGQSQAVTRLNNLVEITNQAYANSQVDARVRLVHAMQVSFADNTTNESALEALTGFRAPSTRTTPDPAFAGLRSAREQYGADLVSLVRDFNTPENDGCGIAWLIGGGQTGIAASDEYFGYSVVSDGRDVGSDGKTYFCREETLAHELGHNMGSQHDRAAATVGGSLEYGVYPYSFGYQTAAGGGDFYTVMAYGDTGQTSFRTFSNPRSTFCGVPCGIENEADNARSLGQTIPKVATFRAAVLPIARLHVPHDVDGDGKSDILLRYYKTAPGNFAYWIMNGAGRTRTGADSMGASYRIVATGDFNGDGKLDIVWAADSIRKLIMWLGNGTSFAKHDMGSYALGWSVAGAGDIDGDGKSDLLLRYYKTAPNNVNYWIMNGKTRLRTGAATMGASYQIATTGDFNGDGKLDIVWTADSVRKIIMWKGNGTSFSSASVGTYGLGWSVAGAGDIDGDGKSDLMFRYYKTAPNNYVYWIMNGASRVREGSGSMGASYRIAMTGDYDGDGKVDIIWSADNVRRLYMSTGTGTAFRLLATYGLGWSVVDS